MKTENSKSVGLVHGWLCPRCNTVNAPWKPTCECRPMPTCTVTIGTSVYGVSTPSTACCAYEKIDNR